MILIGIDENVDNHKKVVELEKIDDLENLDSNILGLIKFSKEDLGKYHERTLLAVEINSVLEFVLLINTQVKYAVCSQEISKKIQNCADGYLTDIKVISLINNLDEIESVAEQEIDGVLGLWNLTKRFKQKEMHTT